MSVPKRVQRKRRRGWRMPDGAVYVGRPSMWGNPFRVTRSSDFHGLPGSWFILDEDGAAYHPDEDTERSARRKAVELFARQILEAGNARVSEEQICAELAGHDLVCWCASSMPCHADVLLAIANQTSPAPDSPAPVKLPATTGPEVGQSRRRTSRSSPVQAE